MENKMEILVIKPGKRPKTVRIDHTLPAMQKAVGGYLEAIYPFEDPVALVVNEEGKLMGLPYNRALRDTSGEIYDTIAGTFFICGLGEGDFCSLPKPLQEKYLQLFFCPELFLRTKDGLLILAQDEE